MGRRQIVRAATKPVGALAKAKKEERETNRDGQHDVVRVEDRGDDGGGVDTEVVNLRADESSDLHKHKNVLTRTTRDLELIKSSWTLRPWQLLTGGEERIVEWDPKIIASGERK